MSKAPIRLSQPRPQQILARLLEEPELVGAVRALSPPALGRVIDAIGLADAGEIVALATPEQLRDLFDQDLWRSERPGQDETFDADRFALWLEVLLEAGEAFAARKLTELDPDFVTLALSRQVLVLNMDELALEMAGMEGARDGSADLLDKALDSCLSQEFGEYQVLSRRHAGWDAVVAVLAEMDRDHHEALRRLLERLCHLSREQIADNGSLYDVLTAAEMLETDAAAEREDRRAREGYIAPSAAASFLALARQQELAELRRATAADPVTRAYFRWYTPSTRVEAERPPQAAPARDERIARLLAELEAIELDPRERPPRPQLPGAIAGDPAAAWFGTGLAALRERDAAVHSRRLQELNYLANVLVAGASTQGRAFRPFAAAEAVLATCNLGLQDLLAATAAPGPVAFAPGPLADALQSHDAVKLFRIGWHLLHHQVALPAARALRQRLALAAGDRLTARALRALETALAAGRPWTARGKIGGLDLDPASQTLARALLDEYPVLPRSGSSEDSRWERIATAAQLAQAHALITQLRGLP